MAVAEHRFCQTAFKQEFVDIEAEDAIEVAISTDAQLGTVYRWDGKRLQGMLA